MHSIKISERNKFGTRVTKHLYRMNGLATSVGYRVASNNQSNIFYMSSRNLRQSLAVVDREQHQHSVKSFVV